MSMIFWPGLGKPTHRLRGLEPAALVRPLRKTDPGTAREDHPQEQKLGQYAEQSFGGRQIACLHVGVMDECRQIAQTELRPK